MLHMGHGINYVVGVDNAVYTQISKIKISDDVRHFIAKNSCVFGGYDASQIPSGQISSKKFQEYLKNSGSGEAVVSEICGLIN